MRCAGFLSEVGICRQVLVPIVPSQPLKCKVIAALFILRM